MALSLSRIQLDALIEQAQMNDRELGKILGVSQSTAWRLRNGHIGKVEPYLRRLQVYLGVSESANGDDNVKLIADLVVLSSQVPDLRNLLLVLRRIMHKNA